MTKTCSVKICQEDRVIGDRLLCHNCRNTWRTCCNIVFGYEQQASKFLVVDQFNSFINKTRI